ncbi:MAG: CAP domain-containing protein [Burkholderiales bacterium]
MQIAALNPEYELFFNQAVALINQHRASKKLPALTRDSRLDAIAAAHSRYMAAKDDLTHVGFNDRFQQANMHSCAENVAWNQITASELIEDWIVSPVHDKNLLKPNASLVGMGRAKAYTTYFVCQP